MYDLWEINLCVTSLLNVLELFFLYTSCSTIWVSRQGRRFLCLFWRETRQRILGPEISPYPEVVRGREWELAGLRSWEAVGAGQQAGVDDATQQRELQLDSREASSRELAWNHGQGQSTPDSWDSRRQDRVQWRRSTQDVCIRVALWNFP